MKRRISSLLCLIIVWAMPIAADAEAKQKATIYGNLRYSFSFVDDEDAGIDGFRGTDNVSRLGVKASHGNETVKAFVHLQISAPADVNAAGHGFGQRFYFGGFKGDFGKVTFGRMTNAYKFPGYSLDCFYDYSRVNAAGAFAGGGASYGLSPATNGFTDNALQYTSPDLAGFKLVGGIAIDDRNEDEVGFLAGGSYSIDEFTVGAVYADNGEGATNYPGIAADGHGVRGYATYKGDGWKLGASYENVQNSGGLDVNYGYVTGTAMIEDLDLDISLSLGIVDKGAAEGFGATCAAFYNVLDNARVYVMTSYAALDNAESPFICSVGATYNFSLTSE